MNLNFFTIVTVEKLVFDMPIFIDDVYHKLISFYNKVINLYLKTLIFIYSQNN